VATVGINNGMNAAVMAVQILALGDEALAKRFAEYRATLAGKIVKANEDLKNVKYNFKVD
jgi:5-(carboxyamino)imidazole ribonucleotide mutase